MKLQGVKKSNRTERGSVIIYLLIALALAGLLIVTSTQGAKRHATAKKIEEIQSLIESDLSIIESAINNCVLIRSDPVDVDGDGDIDAVDNPNAPFPVYDDKSTGGTGEALKDIRCPGAPNSQHVFNHDIGQQFSILDDSEYTMTYFSDGTEGVKVTIARDISDTAWTQAKAQISADAGPCRVEINTVSVTPDCTGGGGCLVYWIKLRSTAVTHSDAACP